MVKMSLNKNDTKYTEPYFRSNQEVITESDTINASLDASIQRIQETLERWTNRGSGWGVDKIDSLYLDIANYMSFKGGSYIDLPSYHKMKKAIIYVKNKGNDCVRMMIRSAMFLADSKIANRPSSYPQKDGLNLDGIDEPTPIS